jgi:hypothetical protein
MSEKIPAARYLIHKAFAFPFLICWVLGTLAIWTPLSFEFARSGALGMLWDSWTTIPLLLFCYAATSGLGFFAGVFLVSWIILPVCRRFNGAPHEVGERVVILSGPHSGKTGHIYAVATGQGGEPLPRIDLGDKARQGFGDLFEDYTLLKICPPDRNAGAVAPPL